MRTHASLIHVRALACAVANDGVALGSGNMVSCACGAALCAETLGASVAELHWACRVPLPLQVWRIYVGSPCSRCPQRWALSWGIRATCPYDFPWQPWHIWAPGGDAARMHRFGSSSGRLMRTGTCLATVCCYAFFFSNGGMRCLSKLRCIRGLPHLVANLLCSEGTVCGDSFRRKKGNGLHSFVAPRSLHTRAGSWKRAVCRAWRVVAFARCFGGRLGLGFVSRMRDDKACGTRANSNGLVLAPLV